MDSNLKLKLTTDSEHHENCVSFCENKVSELGKQEHMPVLNTWITDNQTAQKKKRSYAEFVYNFEEVTLNDNGEGKILSSK